jgi:hypothetical protein
MSVTQPAPPDGDAQSAPSRRRGLGTRALYVVIGAVVAVSVLLRLPFLHNGTYPDEGGMLVVARHWHTGGPYLYGDYFLARPPLILALFRVAGELGGILAVRVIGLGLVAVVVASAAWAGASLAGRRGAVTAAVVSAAFLTNPMLGSREVDAETVGLPFAMTAAACVLAAYRRPRGTPARAWLLVGGGALAVGALLSKQNLADSLAFGLVLVVGSALVEKEDRGRALTDVAWLGLGIAVPVLATLVWAGTASAGIHELVYELYGFRAQGGQAVLTQPTSAQNERLGNLVESSIRSGLVLVVLASLFLLRRRWWRDPVTLALLAMLVTALVGVAGGGQYWIHYALGMVPVTALLAAYAVGKVAAPRLLGALVASCVVISGWHVLTAWQDRRATDESWVGGTTVWLDQMKRPGDSMVVLYGQAGIYETSRIRPAYPFMWTLPMRVLDPRLTDLRSLLSGPDAPTFVLAPTPLDAWDIDPQGLVQQTLDQHYQLVATVCGTPVYLHNGVERPTVPPPTTCE